MICSTLERNDGVGLRRQLYLTLFVPRFQDKEQGKNIVVVGSWNVDEHIDWAKRNVARSYQLRDDGAQKVK